MRLPSNATVTVRKWNKYRFNLYLPAKTIKNAKPTLSFYYPNPLTGELKRVRTYRGLSKLYTNKKLKENAVILADQIIENLKAGHGPFNKTGYDKKNKDCPEILNANTSISKCLDNWLTYRKELYQNGGLRKKGYLSSQNICTFFYNWLSEKQYLSRAPASFNKFDIELFLQTWSKKRDWNKVSYNTYRCLLNTLFNYFLALRIITDNPVKHSRKQNLKNDSSRFKIYEIEELRQVVTALSGDYKFFDLYVAAKLLYKFNIRPIELLWIQVKNIDLVGRLLTLTADKTKNKNEARFALDDESISFLVRFMTDSKSDNYIFGNGGKGSVYQSCDGYLDQRWRVFRKKHSLPLHLKFYALKHSSNYYDLQDGASFEEIRQRNRHSNLQVTTLYIKERLFKNVIKPSESDKFSG